MILPLVNQEPRLLTRQVKREPEVSDHADREFERRRVERELIQDLSQYYLLGQGRSSWTRPTLLPLGKHVTAHHTTTFHSPELFSVINDLEAFCPLLGLSNGPDP